MPTKIGEYLACGLPVIASHGIGDWDDIVTKERVGVLINTYDIDTYRQCIEEITNLLRDPKLTERCLNIATKYFSLNRGCNLYRQAYLSLASLPPS